MFEKGREQNEGLVKNIFLGGERFSAALLL
jgi:hypothetical protein